jgi:FkbM family methyltransferase
MNNDGKSAPLAYRLARRERNKNVQKCLIILKSLLPKHPRTHRIWSGPLKGRRIITSWADYPAAIIGLTERPLLEWFKQNVGVGETWLDVGAHYGYTALALCQQVGPTGRVFAFEPMAATAGCLARTRYLNGLEQLVVVPLALGEADGIQRQKIATIRGMIDSTIQSVSGAGQPTQWSEVILVAQMDWLWPRIAGDDPTIHGIKIDVQGMELPVLRGLAGVFKTHRPKLVVELHRGVDRAEVLALLAEFGYSPNATPIEPVPGEVEAQFIDDRSYAFSPLNGK